MTRKMSFKVTKENTVYNITYIVDFAGITPDRMMDMLVSSSSPRVRGQAALRNMSHKKLEELSRAETKVHINEIGKTSKTVELTDEQLMAMAMKNPRVMAAIIAAQKEQDVHVMTDEEMDQLDEESALEDDPEELDHEL